MATKILAIDAGNTTVSFGLFEGKKLVREFYLPTAGFKFPRIQGKIDKVIVASVVPAVNKTIKRSLKRQPTFISAKNIPELRIRMRDKNEVGADRLVDALAAYKLYGGPAIVVDFGTATTFDVITARGEYLGGAIAPGITLARDTLYERTAKLPKITIEAPKSVIGKDTVEAMRSGLVFGYVAMVEGMIKRIAGSKEMKAESRKQKAEHRAFKVIATGGLAPLICKYTAVIDKIDQQLTLKGLRMIGERL